VHALNYAFNVVFPRLSEDSPAWAVRFVFAVSEHWHLASPYSPVPGVRVAARSEDAIHGMSSHLAH
jgi:hypothetical protein